jgi:hypothetical protein
METDKKKSDADILLDITNALKLTKNGFSVKLGYKSAMSIYNVLDGKNGISDDMAARIVHTFPEVDFNFISSGEGLPLRVGAIPSLQRNLLNIQESPKAGLDAFAGIPDTLLRIERLLIEILNK